MTETYMYDAFGTLTYIQSLNENGVLTEAEDILSRFLYAGEQYDEVTGLYYLRARRYDTKVGRFTQEDTYLGDGRNLYVYVQNNPLKYVDPSGHGKELGCKNSDKNTLLDSILQGAVISSQMADSYSGQVGRDWGNYIAPTVQEDPLGSIRDFAYGADGGLVPLIVNFDSIEHKDLYVTGMMTRWIVIGGMMENSLGNINTTASSETSKLQEALSAADNYTLSDDIYEGHILKRHGSESSYIGKSHFFAEFDIKKAIDNLLKGEDFYILPNTAGRSGYIFEQVFDFPIGKNSTGKLLYKLKVVIDELGNVITAFPK